MTAMFKGLPLIVMLLAGCGSPPRQAALPETAQGGWRLTEIRRQPPKTFGTYEGAGVVHVEVEDTGSSGVALDRTQRTRPEPDTVFFYKGNYFVKVRWEKTGREALHSLVRELQNRLEP